MFHAMWLGEVTIRHRQALYLLFLVNQCLKRNSFTISSSAALSCRGLPSTTAKTSAQGTAVQNDTLQKCINSANHLNVLPFGGAT